MNTKSLFSSISNVVPSFALGTVIAITAQLTPVTAQADILAIGPNAKVLKKANMPKHGETMKVVSNKFGTAKQVKFSKGNVTKRNPKITQWVYPDFSVYFENSHVIHSVVHR